MPRTPTRQRNTTQSFSPEPKPAQRLAKPTPSVQTKTTTMAEPRRSSSSTRSFAPSGGTQSFAPEPKQTARLANKPAPPQVKRTTVAEPVRPSKTTQSFSPNRGTQSFSPPAQQAPRLAPNPAVNRPTPTTSTAVRQVAKKGLGRIAAAALGPVAGAIGTGLLLGEALKGTRPARAAAEGLTNLMAKATGLETRERQMLSNNGMLRAAPGALSKPQGRVTGDSPTKVPSKDLKMLSEKPKMPTSKGSTSSAPKKAPKPSQKATGASKGRGRAMKGAELADFLGLSASSAVRANLMKNAKKK